MRDTSHLVVLVERLFREKRRLRAAQTDSERQLRSVYVAQCEAELAGEREFLGMEPEPAPCNLSTDEPYAALNS